MSTATIGRQTKEMLVQTLTQRLQTGPQLLITSFERLTVAGATELRRSLRNAGSGYVVAKSTLARRALHTIGWDGASQVLQGSVGFVLGGPDVAKTSKILLEFMKAHEGALVIRGGWMDGAVLSLAQVTELATLPPRQELLAQMVVAIEGPLAGLISALEGVLNDVVFVAEEAAKKKPTEGGVTAVPASQAPPTSETKTDTNTDTEGSTS